MEIPEKVNKQIDRSQAVNKADLPTSAIAASALINDYFFPGGGIWKPMTIKAPNLEQAQEIHKAKRQPLTPEGKVEADSETSNQ